MIYVKYIWHLHLSICTNNVTPPGDSQKQKNIICIILLHFVISDKEKETNKVKSRFDGPVDSKGFRILKYQTQDLTKEPEGIVVDILKKNIIYNEGDIIAINKPYGLPSHGGPGVKFSVGGLLHQLAESLNDRDNSLQTLHLIHRLDKETTGVMLLAKRAAVAEELREYFVKRKVVKKYWVITKGIPDPLEGVIKIPITEGSLPNGIHRMILKPEYNKKYWEVMKKRNVEEAQDAITQYKVFKHHQSAALIECQPISGIKHQIRCHLGFGLNTPILGDHKYSHFSKLAPQRLPPDMLTSLGIRASKVRHVPMHLHAKSIVIPEFQNGQNLMVSAKLPKHFLINLRRLKLN
ncbi:hypothetical protein LOTGIDRAFT_140139 [Lottia gigantea]|uniref:Pseudouridylate synthase RPUSD4, mitochondrial n=1 Tax=Lottia gigantea TaxID=225164 RepID=V4AUI7_LOTGI|nr:hypothetical protein LOTGIDRAFT_140139 [Lottia gigantea]ESP00978.1 hypothetical protein LOTGIDRAFT_140139 [Lottia gigantea]